MANVIISPNMLLPIPVPGQDPGPDWANNIVACLNAIDSHNHALNQGVDVNPSGLLINSDLTFNSNNAIALRSTRYTPQSVPLSLASDINCLYVSGVDIWANDGNGNQIQITKNGGVNGSPGSIGNLTAPASVNYVSGTGTFVFQSGSTTPGNLDAASLTLRPQISGSPPGVKLVVPNSIASSFTLTLPNAVASSSNSIFVSDSSGNLTYLTIGSGLAVAGGVLSATLSAVGTPVVSSSTGPFNNSGGGLVLVTNASVTITTNGGPVMLMCQSDGSGNPGFVTPGNNTGAGFAATNFYWYRNGGSIAQYAFELECSGTILQTIMAPGQLNFLDVGVSGSPGTYTYQLYNNASSNQIGELHYCKIVAFEL